VEIGKTLTVTDREQWRSWLAKHHAREREIWLIYHRKSSGRPRIPYNDAVEEALCYGWIDSIVKGIDGERYAQRFSPRRPGSGVSELNRARIRRLLRQKRMTSAGRNAVAGFLNLERERFTIAPDILKRLRSDRQVWKHFQELPEDYRRVRIGFIESRRRHGAQAFRKSLEHFVEMTAGKKQFGMFR
jgi:uncharacterized protein YdeI (YjbR/CyaY-like superfamily)